MSSIRVTYSGLITFVLMLVSIVTGLIFTLIVTRRLDQIEFGLWSLIGGIIAYSLIFGLITGNSNIVKVPSKKFEQIEIICKSINKIFDFRKIFFF